MPQSGPRVLQGPGENAGAIDIGDGWAVVFKIESHNHPSFIEPFQGAATGVGGILRDIFTMGARPIALLDSLRFGDPEDPKTRRLIEGVVSGISWYGNCFGCPTVGGEIAFAPEYAGNPLVNVMCVGLVRADRIFRARAEGVGNPVFYAEFLAPLFVLAAALWLAERDDERKDLLFILLAILFVALGWGTSVGMLGSRIARGIFALMAAWSFVLFQAAAFLYDKSWDTFPVNVNDDTSKLFNWSDPQWLAVLRLVPLADERAIAGAALSALVLLLLVRLELRAYRGSELASKV